MLEWIDVTTTPDLPADEIALVGSF
jgi:hypothetical protein